MYVEVAVAKIGKYATSESGDTFEMVERPRGGFSMVLADGQRSGKSAKFISNLVARKAISLLGEGVRDEAAARAANDYLFAYRGGSVSATLNIVSLISARRRIVVARNNPAPVYVLRGTEMTVLDGPCCPAGIYENAEPSIEELDIDGPLVIVAFTDGLSSAGRRRGAEVDVPAQILARAAEGSASAEGLADHLLAAALAADAGRPVDDTSVLVLAINDGDVPDGCRRLRVRAPLGPPIEP